METLKGINVFFFLRILLTCLVVIHSAHAETIRLTKVEGQKITVTCPTLTEGDLMATSFIKRIDNNYITLYTRRGKQAFQRRTDHNEDVTLDSANNVMTVNNLKIKDNGATYSCKLFSSKREVHNSVIVKVLVPPKIKFTLTPEGPYEPNTAITVSCTVERVSPRPTSLAVRVAGRIYREPSVTTNADGTLRYSLVRRHVIIEGDDGKDADCRVTSQDRKQYRKRERMLLVRPPSGKPSVTTSRTVLRPGDLLRLTCNLNNKGVPAANKYTWYKNGKFIKDSGKSHVWNIRVTSEAVSGSFSCKAANKKGSSEVSIPQCVAFTRETKTKKASGIPMWISIVSILLNIAALVFIVMVYVKPKVVQYLAEREEKKLKKLNKSPLILNESKKEEKKSEKDGSTGSQPSVKENPIETHLYDMPPTDNHTYDIGHIPTDKGLVGEKDEKDKAAYEDMRL